MFSPLLAHHCLVLRRVCHNRQERLLTLHRLALSASARTLIYHSCMCVCFSCRNTLDGGSYLASIWSTIHQIFGLGVSVAFKRTAQSFKKSSCHINFCSLCKIWRSAMVAKQQAAISLKCRPQHALLSGSDVSCAAENYIRIRLSPQFDPCPSFLYTVSVMMWDVWILKTMTLLETVYRARLGFFWRWSYYATLQVCILYFAWKAWRLIITDSTLYLHAHSLPPSLSLSPHGEAILQARHPAA